MTKSKNLNDARKDERTGRRTYLIERERDRTGERQNGRETVIVIEVQYPTPNREARAREGNGKARAREGNGKAIQG